ncbi:hypothetical protein [Amycolatopsis sp. NPDC004079]|uniref:hypothetical protein n=1 Tax=Amycolatopsis sp. NPDC004079 TaxID=3154549 RepID=UPI0033B0E2C3
MRRTAQPDADVTPWFAAYLSATAVYAASRRDDTVADLNLTAAELEQTVVVMALHMLAITEARDAQAALEALPALTLDNVADMHEAFVEPARARFQPEPDDPGFDVFTALVEKMPAPEDVMLAVWDGKDQRGPEYAHARKDLTRLVDIARTLVAAAENEVTRRGNSTPERIVDILEHVRSLGEA